MATRKSGNILWSSGSSQILVSRNIFVLRLILMVGSRSIHNSSFLHIKKATDRPTVVAKTFLCNLNNNASIQYNGGLLPDSILLTQCYYHRGTRLNAMKRFCICSL